MAEGGWLVVEPHNRFLRPVLRAVNAWSDRALCTREGPPKPPQKRGAKCMQNGENVDAEKLMALVGMEPKSWPACRVTTNLFLKATTDASCRKVECLASRRADEVSALYKMAATLLLLFTPSYISCAPSISSNTSLPASRPLSLSVENQAMSS